MSLSHKESGGELNIRLTILKTTMLDIVSLPDDPEHKLTDYPALLSGCSDFSHQVEDGFLLIWTNLDIEYAMMYMCQRRS